MEHTGIQGLRQVVNPSVFEQSRRTVTVRKEVRATEDLDVGFRIKCATDFIKWRNSAQRSPVLKSGVRDQDK